MTPFSPEMDRLIIDTVGSLVIIADKQGRIVRSNPAFKRLLGYELDDIYGQFIWDVLTLPEHRQRAMERFARTMKGESFTADAVWQGAGGRRKHVSFLLRGAPGEDGSIQYSIGTGFDVTARVEAETALADSEQYFRNMIEHAAIAIAVVDSAGRYLHVNPEFTQLTGYSAQELLSRDLLSITHPDDRSRNRTLVEAVFQGQRQTYVLEKRYIRKNGEVVLVKVSASLASSGPGKAPMLIGLFENITERRRSEEAQARALEEVRLLNETLEQRVKLRTAELQARTEDLARSEQSFRDQSRILRLVLDSMRDGVFVADETGQVVLLNPAAERMTSPITPGAQTVQERARKPWFYRSDGVTPYRPEEMQLWRSTRGEVIENEDVLIRRESRPDIWVSGTSQPLREENGQIRGAVLVSRDITERRRHEEDLLVANQTLRERERHFRELAESHLRLAREVEHRVRNNLAGLLGLVSLMRERATDVKSFADAIQGRLSAMRHVHELLADRCWASVTLAELIGGALATLRHLAPFPVAAKLRGDEIFIPARQVLPLTMVVVEWFMNSCKYGAHSVPSGAVEISWERAAEPPPGVKLCWREEGGPPITGPVVASLGTELVNGFVSRELRGRCELTYPPTGVEHCIEFPLQAEEAAKSATA